MRDGVEIWKEFLASLRKGKLTHDKLHPYDESLKEPLMGFLTTIKEKASSEELEVTPETHRVGNQIHYLVPLTFDGERTTYCFTFLAEGDEWYLQHIESIFIRLDRIPSLPTSTFPDLPEEKKAWMREEIHVTKQVRLFNFLSREKGRDSALNWFRDGAGYFLAARTWVPFAPPPKAFILYVCWEQANLRGNSVTLEKMDDSEAVVRIRSNYLRLYTHSAHLKLQISLDDYRRILETIWQDRASNAGWELGMTYSQDECVLNFKRGT